MTKDKTHGGSAWRRLGIGLLLAVLALAARAAPAVVYYVHSDHLDTPRLVTDGQARVVWRRTPLDEPFGTTPPEADPDGDGAAFMFNLRFPGQYFDGETNTNYNYFRDYDPATGRYIQSDPIGLEGGINTYTYVNGNPISYTDPTGEIGWLGAGIGAGIELGIQAFKNYRAGCDLLDLDNYNWYDVGIAAAVGAVAPGWFAVGKNTANSGRAIGSLSEQLGRAQTVNRASKIAGRIQDHTSSIAGDLVTQGAFQGAKYIGKQVTDAGGANDCTCRK